MPVLLLADIQNARLGDATAKALSAASALGESVHVLVAGHDVAPIAEAAARLSSVDKILLADHARYAHRLAEPMAALIVHLAPAYGAIVAAATSAAKNILPRVAALLDVMQISEITKIHAPNVFERPIYAGNAIEMVESLDAIKVLTVRTAAFPPADEGAPAPIEKLPVAADPGLSRFVAEMLTHSDRPEVGAARIVVSGGRALQSAENFSALIGPLAETLGAGIGASRAAVDAGYAPNDWQIGQTGKVVAPDLYIAIGISGAIQHLAGMKDSKVIVAINKDEDAPIFKVADYGLVGDLFAIVPALNDELAKLGYKGHQA
ncbi:MAG: FAD-binding protein [Methylovirgula sp.]|jgi:electron transfer flavoprotein alpha subunit